MHGGTQTQYANISFDAFVDAINTRIKHCDTLDT